MSGHRTDESVIRPSLAKNPKLTKGQKEFLRDFVNAEQETFERIMKELETYAPTKWVDVYMKMNQMVIPKESNINVNVGLNRDFQELVNMGRMSSRRITSANAGELEKLDSFEEIVDEPKFRETIPGYDRHRRLPENDVEVIDEDTYQ
jgi:hypothetical protein